MNRPVGVRKGKWECSTEKTIFGQKIGFFITQKAYFQFIQSCELMENYCILYLLYLLYLLFHLELHPLNRVSE